MLRGYDENSQEASHALYARGTTSLFVRIPSSIANTWLPIWTQVRTFRIAHSAFCQAAEGRDLQASAHRALESCQIEPR